MLLFNSIVNLPTVKVTDYTAICSSDGGKFLASVSLGSYFQQQVSTFHTWICSVTSFPVSYVADLLKVEIDMMAAEAARIETWISDLE